MACCPRMISVSVMPGAASPTAVAAGVAADVPSGLTEAVATAVGLAVSSSPSPPPQATVREMIARHARRKTNEPVPRLDASSAYRMGLALPPLRLGPPALVFGCAQNATSGPIWCQPRGADETAAYHRWPMC